MAVNASSAPFDATRTAASEGAALAHARKVAEALAAAATPPPMTIEHALDFLHKELGKMEEPILERIEREMIKRVVVEQEGNILKASEKLGITRATLRKRIDELGIKA
jgi:two-component system nitrogen regulation response regulator GlnG